MNPSRPAAIQGLFEPLEQLAQVGAGSSAKPSPPTGAAAMSTFELLAKGIAERQHQPVPFDRRSEGRGRRF